MKCSRKTIFATMLIFALLFSNTMTICASENTPIASYDLEAGGTQTFHLEDSDGNEIIVTVEELTGNSRVSNGSYKVTYEYLNIWEAGFTVTVSGNKITRAYSPFYSCSLGSISNASLSLNNRTKASYTFIHKWALFNASTGVVATISGTDLNVSKL